METKECPNCNVKVGKSEVTCPSCKVNFEELEDAVTTVERAQKIIEKRKPAPPAPPTPPPPTNQPEAKRNVFTSLGKVLRGQ